MKIAFFGSSLVSAYWNGAATYYRGVIRSLHRLGHKIIFYEPDAWERQKHRDIPDPPYARSAVYSAADGAGIVRVVKEAAAGADLLIKASGVGVFDDLLEEAVLEFGSRRAMTAFWDVDAAATLERMGENPEDPLRSLIPSYDLVLTYGGGDPVIRAYRELGAKRCIPIYNALDPDTHYRVAEEKRFRAALGFLGNRLPDREQRVLEFFFRPARMNSGLRFMLGGSGWKKVVAEYAGVDYLGHVYTCDHNAFNSSSTAVLNICRDSMARFGFSPPTRLFEAAGAGACLITDVWEGIEMFLEPGRECLVAQSGAEVSDHLRDLSASRAKEIGRAALDRILGEHTYVHRAAQLDQVFRAL